MAVFDVDSAERGMFEGAEERPQIRVGQSCSPSPSPDGAAFAAGIAIEKLGSFAGSRDEAFPGTLWRRRLALNVTESLARLLRRAESVEEIRDAHCFAGGGGDPGPSGHLLRLIYDVAKPSAMDAKRLAVILGPSIGDQTKVEAGLRGMFFKVRHDESPVRFAARAAAQILEQWPRARSEALLVADVVLALSLKWPSPVPLLASEIKASDLRSVETYANGDLTWLSACYGAYERAARKATGVAFELGRRSEVLKAGATVVRSKGSKSAVDMFLREEAVSPGMLVRRASMSDRAARRICDRLVALGLVRELTGRTTHRLYGL